MQEYKELYGSNAFKLYGTYEDYGAYAFRVEMNSCLPSGLNFGFSGAALFYFAQNEEDNFRQELSKMYDSLKGECHIQDCEFGNEIRLFFVGRQLKIQGKFYDGEQLLKFSDDVDQTIIPRIISLLR